MGLDAARGIRRLAYPSTPASPTGAKPWASPCRANQARPAVNTACGRNAARSDLGTAQSAFMTTSWRLPRSPRASGRATMGLARRVNPSCSPIERTGANGLNSRSNSRCGSSGGRFDNAMKWPGLSSRHRKSRRRSSLSANKAHTSLCEAPARSAGLAGMSSSANAVTGASRRSRARDKNSSVTAFQCRAPPPPAGQIASGAVNAVGRDETPSGGAAAPPPPRLDRPHLAQ
jgi:hypothetical protein